jgi:hypothetical protein
MTCTRLHQPQLLHAILITWKSLHFVTLLYTHVTKDCVIFEANLESYDGLIGPKGHVQNIINILKLVTTKSDDMCKISPTTFLGFTRVLYHSLKPRSSRKLYEACLLF